MRKKIKITGGKKDIIFPLHKDNKNPENPEIRGPIVVVVDITTGETFEYDKTTGVLKNRFPPGGGQSIYKSISPEIATIIEYTCYAYFILNLSATMDYIIKNIKKRPYISLGLIFAVIAIISFIVNWW